MLKHTNGAAGSRLPRPDSSVLEHRSPDPSHRYRSPVAVLNSSRISQQYPLSISQLHDTSKHTVYSNSILTPATKSLNGGLNISHARPRSVVSKFISKSERIGIKEMLVSLGLLCLVSLLLALLSLIFLLKISPVTANDVRELLRAEQLTVINYH